MWIRTAELHANAFLQSYRTILLYDDKRLIGCGRMISDGCYQGAIYDVAVDEDYRGHGYGKMILKELVEGLDEMSIMLYASPGKEVFYEQFDFYHAKTAMIRFSNVKRMKEKGFI